jgi:hypothetical protein
MSLPHKLYITNFAGACYLTWCWWCGYLQQVTLADEHHMWAYIGALFLLGVISTFHLAFRLERARADATTKSAKALLIRGEHLGVIASLLFILGIIGNAIGIRAGFGHITADALSSADGVRSLFAQFLAGSVTTFGSTIVGGSLSAWTMVNAQMLWTETSLLELERS